MEVSHPLGTKSEKLLAETPGGPGLRGLHRHGSPHLSGRGGGREPTPGGVRLRASLFFLRGEGASCCFLFLEFLFFLLFVCVCMCSVFCLLLRCVYLFIYLL